MVRTVRGTNSQWYEKSGHQSQTPLGSWSKKRRHDGTDDGTPGGRYATGYVRRTHDGTLVRGVVQATGQTMRHVSLPVVMWFVITFLT